MLRFLSTDQVRLLLLFFMALGGFQILSGQIDNYDCKTPPPLCSASDLHG